MIEVNYWPRELRLTVKGHAVNENMEGNPDVCAGASMLVYSLMNAMDGFNAEKWCKCVYFEGNGEAYMRMMKPKWHKFKALRVAMGMTLGGLGMLAQQYPQLVKVEVCTGKPFDDKAAIERALGEALFCPSHSPQNRPTISHVKGRPLTGRKENP